MQYQNYLQKIIEAVAILSDESFSFAGRKFSATVNSFEKSGLRNAHPIVNSLSDILYQQCYCRVFNGHYYETNQSMNDNPEFKAILTQSNTTLEKWEKDWIIDQVTPTGPYTARKNGRYRILYPGEFFTGEYQAAGPNEGNSVTVYCPRESFNLQPGFYFVFSNHMNNQQHLSTIIRFYWNVKHTGAGKLIELLTRNLNKYSIPFTFKCLNNPSAYVRSDSAVLYVNKPYYHITAHVLEQVYPQIQSELKEDVPGFTKQMHPGLGLAEDPSTGESFGMSRCAMIAQGIFTAHLAGTSSIKQVIDHIWKTFEGNGARLKVPYLNNGSADIYNFFESSKN